MHFLCISFYGSILKATILLYPYNNFMMWVMKDSLHSPKSEMKALELIGIKTIIKSPPTAHLGHFHSYRQAFLASCKSTILL